LINLGEVYININLGKLENFNNITIKFFSTGLMVAPEINKLDASA